MKKILYTAAECTPFIKTGGLGAVVGSLPKQLKSEGYDVRIAIPAYECIDEKWKKQMEPVVSLPVSLGWRNQMVTVKSFEYEGVICYFLENNFYFCGDSPYSDMWLDIEKFSFFSKAVLEMLSYLEFVPDIIHCHDWQTSLIPVYLKRMYGYDPFYQNIKTIFTLHNMKFQGMTSIDHLKDVAGLPDDLFTYDKLEYYNSANMLKGGIVFADKVTTVSQTYAKEIQQPEYGEGLDELLRCRSNDLSGIVNGIDYQIYDPSQDEFIKYHYNEKTFRNGKKKNKKIMQKKAGLLVKNDAFTCCMISRLTDQKGFDLLGDVMDKLLKQNVQLIILGGGEKQYEDMFSYFAEKYPEKVSANFDYSDEMAKILYAGCDATLMPSRFEPCGLSQLMALRYGTVPIVRRTGGLKDTVKTYNKRYHTGTGFGFDACDSAALLRTVKKAISIFEKEPEEWNGIVERGMKENYSWEASCREYARLYEGL